MISIRMILFIAMAAMAIEGSSKGPCLLKTDDSPQAVMRPVSFDAVQSTDGFWADRAHQAQTVTLRRLWDLAADPEAGHVLDNMRAAASGQGEHAGTNWQDAWLYKWIEAAACVHRETGELKSLDCAKLIVDRRGATPKQGHIFTKATSTTSTMMGSGCITTPAMSSRPSWPTEAN